MYQAFSTTLTAIALFIAMLVLLEVGRRVGNKRLASDPEGARAGTGAVEGAVFALLGLLIAFTFSGAASRFDARRDLVVQESNAIGTAYLRLDLLPANAQPAMREMFRQYLDARLDVYRALPDLQAAYAALGTANDLQTDIWNAALANGQQTGAMPDAIKLLLPALNDMFDIASSRTMAAEMHPPMVIYGLLYLMAMASALLAGYGMSGGRSRSWLHVIALPAVMAIAVYIIIDIEYPRLGLIKVDSFDKTLVDLRAGMDRAETGDIGTHNKTHRPRDDNEQALP